MRIRGEREKVEEGFFFNVESSTNDGKLTGSLMDSFFSKAVFLQMTLWNTVFFAFATFYLITLLFYFPYARESLKSKSQRYKAKGAKS